MSKIETSPWLHERAWPSVAAYLEKDDLILIPVGATEAHGAHAAMMLDTGWAIIEIAEKVGYQSEAAFGRVFKKHFLLGPATYRRQHARLPASGQGHAAPA